MDDRVVIALFRHSITVENQRKAYLGWTDSPLCGDTKELVTNRVYDGYFSSDLMRCVLTANRLFPGSRLQLMKEWREMYFGEWEGQTYEDLKHLQDYQQWLANPFLTGPPQGESYEQFSKRVDTGWTKTKANILEENLKSCAVITHGGVIKYLLSRYAPDERDFWSWHTPHHVGFELIFTRERLRRGARCILLQEVPLTASALG
ncbi:histidine phosphatase family protein [Neobacillus sp. Marseille-QA0830]